ncbi:MAG: choice-of-anchor Q domain-containing protein [Rudaea sp.]
MIRKNPMTRRRLAAAIAACFALAAFATPCFANYDNVTNCNDTGAGSLRSTIASAASGDTVVLNPTAMHCSSITLASGEIVVPQNDLTVKYNADNANQITISGGLDHGIKYFHEYDYRVFHHTGGGKITLQRLNVVGGFYQSVSPTKSVAGGCIDSSGVVDLVRSTVSGCSLTADLGLTFTLRGGGVYAAKGLIMDHSTISESRVENRYFGTYTYNYYSQTFKRTNYYGAPAQGGGAFANNYINAQYSTISENESFSYSFNSLGGGIFLYNANSNNTSSIQQCTISYNEAQRAAGLMAANLSGAFTILNSTISGNELGNFFSDNKGLYQYSYAHGAAILSLGPLSVRNSTITGSNAPGKDAVFFGKTAHSGQVGFASTIIATNFSSFDVSSQYSIVVEGGYNLIQSHANTITFAFPPATGDPLLQPLADNGGPTLTHAFRIGSPAFGSGVRLGNPPTDQRGTGFPRQAPNGDVDIGAYQEQVRDRIFSDGFD